MTQLLNQLQLTLPGITIDSKLNFEEYISTIILCYTKGIIQTIYPQKT